MEPNRLRVRICNNDFHDGSLASKKTKFPIVFELTQDGEIVFIEDDEGGKLQRERFQN